MSLNKNDTKKKLIAMSKSFRNGKFTRVSKAALDELEAQHELAMRKMVSKQPNMGKTIMPLYS